MSSVVSHYDFELICFTAKTDSCSTHSRLSPQTLISAPNPYPTAYSLVSPLVGVKNLKLSMSRLELNYSPLSTFLTSLHCTSKCTSSNLWSPSGPLAHPVHQRKTFLLNSFPTRAPPSCARTTRGQDHGLSRQLSFQNPHQYHCYSCLNKSPSNASRNKKNILNRADQAMGNLSWLQTQLHHTCSLHIRKTSLLWTRQPSPSHTGNLHCSEPCLITFLQISVGPSNGLQGEEDKIFKVGVILEGLPIWSPEL